jgi:hypothetical protein
MSFAEMSLSEAASLSAGRQSQTPVDPRGGSEGGSYDPSPPQIQIPREVVKGGRMCVHAQLPSSLPAGSVDIVGRFLLTFQQYPPSQVGRLLSIEKALQMVQNGASGGCK